MDNGHLFPFLEFQHWSSLLPGSPRPTQQGRVWAAFPTWALKVKLLLIRAGEKHLQWNFLCQKMFLSKIKCLAKIHLFQKHICQEGFSAPRWHFQWESESIAERFIPDLGDERWVVPSPLGWRVCATQVCYNTEWKHCWELKCFPA